MIKYMTNHSTLQVAINRAIEESTLKDEVMQILLEDEVREKEQLTAFSENRGKQFHEVAMWSCQYVMLKFSYSLVKGRKEGR